VIGNPEVCDRELAATRLRLQDAPKQNYTVVLVSASLASLLLMILTILLWRHFARAIVGAPKCDDKMIMMMFFQRE
jgi:hypothetical protein